MVAKILNREVYKPVLKYILNKDSAKILGYENTLDLGSSSLQLFDNSLNHLGTLNETKHKYVHFSLSLPEQDSISDSEFYALSKNYMKDMGYENQPYIIVKHVDTKHPHVHILTSRIMDNRTLISSSFERIKNKDVCRHLETKYNLTTNTSFKRQEDLFKHRLNSYVSSDHSDQNTRAYLRDQINSLTQKYRLRSFEEFNRLLQPYGIVSKASQHQSGRTGISFSLTKDYKSFNMSSIPGNRIHQNFTYPKLKSYFEENNKSKVNNASKFKLKKQINNVLEMFDSINVNELPELLKLFKNVNIKPVSNASGQTLGFTVYDDSGYVYKASEITRALSLKNHLFSLDHTSLNLKSIAVEREVNKISKLVFREAFLNTNKQMTYSAFIKDLSLKSFINSLSHNEPFNSLWNYVDNKDEKFVDDYFHKVFKETKIKLFDTAIKNETYLFHEKIKLQKEIKSSSNINSVELLNSFGLSVQKGIIYDLGNSNLITESEGYHRSIKPADYKMTGFEPLNYLALKSIYSDSEQGPIMLNPKVFFLPEIYPEIYSNLNNGVGEDFSSLALNSYFNHILDNHKTTKETPETLLDGINRKGFYIEKKDFNYFLKSHYTKDGSTKLNEDIFNYLNNGNLIDQLIEDQNLSFNLNYSYQNLYTTHLIEDENYSSAAFNIIIKKSTPLLNAKELEFHLNNGLQKELDLIKLNANKNLSKGKNRYAMNVLLNEGKLYENENYNHFKDELTDFKDKSRGLN